MGKAKKTVLVTGASDGIGLALVKKLLDEGFSVIGTSRKGTIDGIANPGLFVVQLDVTDPQSIQSAAGIIKSNYPKIDILVNNAGVGSDLGTSIPERSTFEQTINTNVTGLVFFSEEMIPLIANGGQVINVSSKLGSFGLEPHTNSTAYRMSKAAINMYSKVLAQRLSNKDIGVISIHPGWVKTKLATKGAPLDTATSARGIYDILMKEKPTGSFWNAETGDQLPW